jgi:hypothetical protein
MNERDQFPDMLPISVTLMGEDYDLFKFIIDQGIDARLEAFVDSNFHYRGPRLMLYFHPCELTILLRRLSELETEEADQWAEDIVNSWYFEKED